MDIKNNSEPKVSIIIPAYKAEEFIRNVVESREQVLKEMKLDYELIVVIDGQSLASAKELAKIKSNRLKIFHYKRNRGKGFAIRFGMMRARGDYIGFIDAGYDLPSENLRIGIKEIIDTDADVVMASKWHRDSQLEYSFFRTVLSRAYNLFVRFLFRLGVSDTQVGMKIFKREVVDLVLPRLLVKRFAFDIEMLAVSTYLGFSGFRECAVILKEDTKSTVGIGDGLRVYWDTLAIFYRLYVRHYYKKPRGRQIDKWKRELINLKLIGRSESSNSK